MKRILSLFILFNLLMMPVSAAANDVLPELPNLPDFDSVLPPDGMDVFAPSSTPAQVAPKQAVPQQSTPAQQQTKPVTATPSTTQAKPVSSPQTTPPKTVVTPVQKPAQKQVSTTKKNTNTTNNSYYKNNKTSYVIPKGKKFKVHLAQSISSSTPVGTRISFRSIYPETSRYITIPSGTVFYGKITDSHGPQITGNGGLIVIEVNQIVYKGTAYNIDAKVSVANGKHIFLNNIKGKRMYFQSIPKALKPGSNYFKKMWRLTCKLAKNESGVEIILTPFSLVAGVLVYAVNFVASPVLAIFYKGKSITIPANSQFTIQLREDAVLLR